MPHKDPEARRAYSRKKYYANLERERASRRKSGRKAYAANQHRVPGVERFVCRKCHTEKDACEFPARGKQCKACCKVYMENYNATNHAKNLARGRAYRAQHAAEDRARCRRYYVENKDTYKAYQKAYYETNQARIAAQGRLYREKNRAHRKAVFLAWQKAHPDIYRASQDRYRARKNQVEINDFTPAQWLALQEACDHRCAYCGKRAKGKLTKDHIIPLSKRGNHTLSNIIPACRQCNCTKRDGPVLTPVQPFLLL